MKWKLKFSEAGKKDYRILKNVAIVIIFGMVGASIITIRQDVSGTLVGFALAYISLYYSFKSMEGSLENEEKMMYQQIGGYIPSKYLNQKIYENYRSIGGKIEIKKPNFIENQKHYQLLVNELLKEENGITFQYKENLFRQEYFCVLKRNGNPYSAKSASKEMAVCIAFLKSQGVPVD